MTDISEPEGAMRPQVRALSLRDLRDALVLGWRDFRYAPLFGLFFSAVYVLGGFLMIWLGAGHVTWVLATSLGFPLAAPFAAVGLYEVSRRIEQGKPLNFIQVLGVVWGERGRQVPWLGAIIVIYFLFWTFLAHMLFALMMGLSTMTNVTSDLSFLWSPAGLRMLAVEVVVGAAVAFLLFALTVVSLPLLLDREVDFVTAMLVSVELVRDNLGVMLLWAMFIAGASLVAMVPWFLGLILVLPILGHASWHVYRRALD